MDLREVNEFHLHGIRNLDERIETVVSGIRAQIAAAITQGLTAADFPFYRVSDAIADLLLACAWDKRDKERAGEL